MRSRKLAIRLGYPVIGALALAMFAPSRGLTQEATDRFRGVRAAEGEGDPPQSGCVGGSDARVMGMLFVNGAFAGDDILDPARPEIVVYETAPDGRLRLTGPISQC